MLCTSSGCPYTFLPSRQPPQSFPHTYVSTGVTFTSLAKCPCPFLLVNDRLPRLNFFITSLVLSSQHSLHLNTFHCRHKNFVIGLLKEMCFLTGSWFSTSCSKSTLKLPHKLQDHSDSNPEPQLEAQTDKLLTTQYCRTPVACSVYCHGSSLRCS